MEAGFFRTDLLDPYNVRHAPSTIADYADEGSAGDIVSGYHGQQQGDPAKLGNVLVKLAGTGNPPKQFLAGNHGFAVPKETFGGQLAGFQAYDELSRSTDGSF